MMDITANGERRIAEDGWTVADFLRAFDINERIVVVEYNGEIIARAAFGETRLAAGDNLEIVQMAAGG